MTMALTTGVPVLRTERLDLWHPAATDLAGLYAMVAPEAVRRFLGNRPTTMAEESARLLRNAGSWALYGYGTFVMRTRGADAILGICGVFHSWRGFGEGLDDVPEVGWILGEASWGKGLAGEAMRAVLAWFDEAHGPRRIACMIEEGHHASLRLAHALGFEAYAVHQAEGDERPLVLLERLKAEKPEGDAR
jgi:RimJ/RimL family protein N-acetyltransferase